MGKVKAVLLAVPSISMFGYFDIVDNACSDMSCSAYESHRNDHRHRGVLPWPEFGMTVWHANALSDANCI